MSKDREIQKRIFTDAMSGNQIPALSNNAGGFYAVESFDKKWFFHPIGVNCQVNDNPPPQDSEKD